MVRRWDSRGRRMVKSLFLISFGLFSDLMAVLRRKEMGGMANVKSGRRVPIAVREVGRGRKRVFLVCQASLVVCVSA